MQYCSLQHRTVLPITSTTECCFCFGSISILSGVVSLLFSSSILGTYQLGKLIFQCPIFLPFHTVHGVLKARILNQEYGSATFVLLVYYVYQDTSLRGWLLIKVKYFLCCLQV